jgi:hypothetical protein
MWLGEHIAFHIAFRLCKTAGHLVARTTHVRGYRNLAFFFLYKFM